jgi:hypothetical protein
MSPRDLLNVLHRLGFRVWIERDRLETAAPKSLLTDELRAAIREHRPHLIAILVGEGGIRRSDAGPAAAAAGLRGAGHLAASAAVHAGGSGGL